QFRGTAIKANYRPLGLVEVQDFLLEVDIDVKRFQEVQAHQPARVEAVSLQTREFDRASFHIGGFRVSHFERVQLYQSYISFFGDNDSNADLAPPFGQL